MSYTDDRPRLGILDLSDGPSGLSRYLEMLWPALTSEFRVVVFGDPRGPYTSFPDAEFVPLPEKLWNQRPGSPEVVSAPATVPSRTSPYQSLRKLYTTCMPRGVRWSVGFAQRVRTLAGVLKRHPVDVVYLPLCGPEMTPHAAWLAGIPARVGVLHMQPPEVLSSKAKLLWRLMAGRLTRLIAVSGRVAMKWQALIPNASKIVAIPNGISVPERVVEPAHRAEMRTSYGLSLERPVWLAAGRLCHHKGYSFLLDAVARLRPRHPHIQLAIAGEGPLLGELTAQRDRLGLQENVRFLGQVQNMSALYQCVDGFVLSSVSEAMPYVLLEAMAHGLPVVATAVGGVPELVQNEVNGILCPPGDADRLAAGMDLCLSQPPVAQALAREGKKTVELKYSVHEMRAATVSAFRLVVRKAPLSHHLCQPQSS